MQNIPCGLTPAELPAREQSHEQNSDFATLINIFSSHQAKKIKKNFTCRAYHSLCTGLIQSSRKMLRWREGLECARYAPC